MLLRFVYCSMRSTKTGIVDKSVNPTELLGRGLYQFLAGTRIRHVYCHSDRVTATVSNPGSSRLDSVGPTGGDDHRTTCIGVRLRYADPQARGRPRDDRNPSIYPEAINHLFAHPLRRIMALVPGPGIPEVT